MWLIGVPYSEHSSFFELTCFALSLPCRPEMKMIATVNVGNEKRCVMTSVSVCKVLMG
jgi:DNA cross-link repair 1A protein